MAKKKQPAAEQPTTIELGAELQRDDAGYGALVGVPCNRGNMSIKPAHGEALLKQLAAQQMEARVITLREVAGSGDENAQEALAELTEDDSVISWQPVPPDGEGWQLVAVLYHLHKENLSNDEVDAVAVWARPQTVETAKAPDGEAPFDPAETQQHAAMFLIGNLMEACKRRFIGLAAPWSQLSENEQSRTLRYLSEDVRVAVGHAIRAIASNERVTFLAEVESVQFKGASDVKAALKLVNTPESHALADRAGGFVTIVIEDTAELLDIPEAALKGEADQRPLFDQSTEGTALDTKPEEALA